jgi:hypothetical protein
MTEFGVNRLVQELEEIGFAIERIATPENQYVALREYEIIVGKFSGRKIDLALQATPDYPNSVHSSIHVKATPQLYETSENIEKVRNVQASPLGPEWRYWSKNFNWAAETKKDARRLMARITTIFEHA